MKAVDAILPALRQLVVDPDPLGKRLHRADDAINSWLAQSKDPDEQRQMLQALNSAVGAMPISEFWLEVRNSIAQRLNQ